MRAFLPFLIVALIYAAVAVDFWRLAKTPGGEKGRHWHSLAIAVGLVLHGWLLYKGMFIGDKTLPGINFDFAKSLSLVFWMTVLIYWITDIRQTFNSLQALVLPPAAFFVLLQGSMHQFNVLPYVDQPLFILHLVIALVAYSLFTFAALHAMLMGAAERVLHKKSALIKLPEFPPLISMETLLFRVITLGFLLLSLTLLSGMLFSDQIFHKPMTFNHKNFFTVLSWLVYGSLLVGRYAYGWRGRMAIRWSLAGFFLLLLAYTGSKFVLQFLIHKV